jgi:hypothetical protein
LAPLPPAALRSPAANDLHQVAAALDMLHLHTSQLWKQLIDTREIARPSDPHTENNLMIGDTP